MKTQRFNWPLWVGFLTSVAAVLSYPFVFATFPVTRDFPWANLLLCGVAAVFLWLGVRRAFASDRPHPKRSKIAASLVATLSIVIVVLFVFSTLIMARWLPPSHGAPQIGQKAPDFSLTDTAGKSVSLAELLSQPINGRAPQATHFLSYLIPEPR